MNCEVVHCIAHILFSMAIVSQRSCSLGKVNVRTTFSQGIFLTKWGHAEDGVDWFQHRLLEVHGYAHFLEANLS